MADMSKLPAPFTKKVKGGDELIFTTSKDRLWSYHFSLLSFKKVVTEIKLEKFNAGCLVYDRVNMCRKFTEENEDDRGFFMEIDLDIMMYTDKSRLTRVVYNLVTNAMKNCKKGNIIVSLQKDQTGVYFTVSDEIIEECRVHSTCSVRLGQVLSPQPSIWWHLWKNLMAKAGNLFHTYKL